MKLYISYVGHCIQDCGFYYNTYQNFDYITIIFNLKQP